MEFSGIGAGMAALAFWGFIASVAIAGIWSDIRKREAKHETVRRMIESGQSIDRELVDKLLSLSGDGNKRLDRDFNLTGLWVLPAAVGLSVFGLILGSKYPDALVPILGASALLGCIGLGALVAARIAKRWYPEDSDAVRH